MFRRLENLMSLYSRGGLIFGDVNWVTYFGGLYSGGGQSLYGILRYIKPCSTERRHFSRFTKDL